MLEKTKGAIKNWQYIDTLATLGVHDTGQIIVRENWRVNQELDNPEINYNIFTSSAPSSGHCDGCRKES